MKPLAVGAAGGDAEGGDAGGLGLGPRDAGGAHFVGVAHPAQRLDMIVGVAHPAHSLEMIVVVDVVGHRHHLVHRHLHLTMKSKTIVHLAKQELKVNRPKP